MLNALEGLFVEGPDQVRWNFLPNLRNIYEREKNRLRRWWRMYLLGSSFPIFPRSSRLPWRISLTSLRKELLWISRLTNWLSSSRHCSRTPHLGPIPFKNCRVDMLFEIASRYFFRLIRDFALLLLCAFGLLLTTLTPWRDIIILLLQRFCGGRHAALKGVGPFPSFRPTSVSKLCIELISRVGYRVRFFRPR